MKTERYLSALTVALLLCAAARCQAADYLSRCVRDYPTSIAALKARQNAKDWGLKLDE